MRSDSPVLDAFIAAAAACDPIHAEALHREAENADPRSGERETLCRALTAASRAGSAAVGEEMRSSLIQNGDDAFQELIRFRPATTHGSPAEGIVAALARVLELAADQLGPFRGGERGAFKGPTEKPQVVREIRPSPDLMVGMARAAGHVVGLAGAAGRLDSRTEVRAVIDGCPVCGCAVTPTGGSHRRISPGEGPVIESGRCALGHRLNRPQATATTWNLAGSNEIWSSAAV